MPALSADYYKNVFINCPFDLDYKPLFHAIVFAIYDCGFIPRCALETEGSGDVRINKIMDLIAQCCYGVHDISRVELTDRQLPRFNMPLELGIFIGARRFGTKKEQSRDYIILDAESGRYQQFISDLAGQDIKAHHGEVVQAILHIRNWLASKAGKAIHGGRVMAERYEEFLADLPDLATTLHQDADQLTHQDFCMWAQVWLEQHSLAH